MARLYVLSGPDLGKIHKLDPNAKEWVLGRSKQADITLKGNAISREHARLERLEAGWAIADLGSSNGTKVGGEKLAEAWLEDGDELALGDVELRFRLDAKPSESAKSPEPAKAAKPQAALQPDLEIDFDPDGLESDSPGGGLELEGDWDEAAEAPVAPIKRAPAPKVAAPAAAAEPEAPLSRAERERAKLSAQAAPRGDNRMAGGGRVLQYQRTAQKDGLLNADFSQLSGPVRLLLLALAFAVFGGLGYGAFLLAQGATGGGPDSGADSDVELGQEL